MSEQTNLEEKLISYENLERFKSNLEDTYNKPEGLAQLDSTGHIRSNQIPASAISGIEECDNMSEFPNPGETRKLYVDLSTNASYRWDDTLQEYVPMSSPDAVKFTSQNLTTEQKAQARQNIGAASSDNEGAVQYEPQQLTEAQKAQARQNIGALGTNDIPQVPADVLRSSQQNLTNEQKTQARQNINAASATEVNGLSDAVSGLNDQINNFGNFVREVTQSEDGIEVTYDNNQVVNIPTGLIFDGGYVDENNYLHLKNGEDTISDDIFTPIQLPAGGSGGGGSFITLTNVVKTNTARNGADALFGFTATSADDTELTVKWYVNNVLQTTVIEDSGTTFSFNARDYLTPSRENNIKVTIESGGGASVTRRWTVKTVAFSVEWGNSINSIMLYTTNSNVYIPVNVSAEAGSTNVVTLTIGNETLTKTVNGSITTTFEVNKNLFSVGVNAVSATMHSSEDVTDISNTINFNAIWGYGAIDPIVAFAETNIQCEQYDVVNIEYFVFDPNNEMATCEFQITGENAIISTVSRSIQTYQYSPLTAGTKTVTVACGLGMDTLTLAVSQSQYVLSYYTDDSLQYNLDPIGHSNADSDRNQFGGLIFSQNFDWLNGGFKADTNGVPAFVIKKGNRVTLPRAVFSDNDANGKTIDISFKVTNSDQYNAVAIQELNNGSTRGIILRANNGEIKLNNVAGQEFRYCEDSRIDLSILVESIVNQRVATLWLDGIPSKVNEYEPGMLVQDENAMVIGSDHCDVWIYAIRVYNTELSKKQMIQNYVSEGNTTREKADRYRINTIFDEHDKITPAALHTVIPDLTIVEIEAPRMTVSKSDPVTANITILDGMSTLELRQVLFKVQGTSSAAYGRSAYNLDIDFRSSGETYKISESSIPVNYMTIKVNVASSENANNINAVDWYNTFQPYLTESRDTPGVRDTVEGKPCAVFIKNTAETDVWFSSQLVEPGETVLYAMGDICNSKKNTAVFGQDGQGEHPTKACIEVSGNDTECQRFRSTAAVFNPSADDGDGRWETTIIENGQTKISKEFEWRMVPDGSYSDTDSNMYEVVQSWNSLVAWVVSTIGNGTKFKREIGNYFAINSLLYHFLFIEYFAGYDNVSKNTFYSYDWDEQAGRYLWNIKAAYDMDTILGADNDGKPFGDYGLDFDSTNNGRSYFNAVDNPIWVNIKANFQNELSALYNTLRTAGAWNSNDILNKWDVYQSKRPHAAMIADAYIKYIYPYKTSGMTIDNEVKSYDDSYLPRLQGSKTYWRKQFLTYQTAYMDGKYGYYSKTNSMQFRTNCASSRRSFEIKSYATTYVTLIVDDNKVGSQRVEAGQQVVFNNVSVGTNTTLYVTPDRLIQYIRPLNETDNSTFTASGATKLMEAVLGGTSVNNSWPSGTGVNIPSVILKELSIRNMTNFSNALNLSQNVELETVDTRGTNAGLITLPSFAPLTSVQLNACTGIVADNLNNVQTFTMQNGNNLVSIRVENCNATVNNALATYIVQATSIQQVATRRIRAINVNWTFDNLDALAKIASTWKGYNALGEDQNAPIVTGAIHVSSMSTKKLEAIHAVWGSGELENSLDTENRVWTGNNLTITYDLAIPYYTVTFVNIDGSAIKDRNNNDYIQYVDTGNYIYDPVQAGEIDAPVYIDPDGQYTYTYNGWQNIDTPVRADRTVAPDYIQTVITYTVRWFDKVNGTLYDIRENVPYGSEAVYDPNGTIGFPTLDDQEVADVYKVFTGWDKSTGFVTQNLDVYAVWDSARLPNVGAKELKDMSIAEIYGIVKANRADSYFEDEDYVDITVGKDFNFSNVQSQVLLTNTFFDGTHIQKFDNIRLFDENAPSFTLAVDFEFTNPVENATLISCCDSTGDIEGFRVHYHRQYGNSTQNHSIKVIWGNMSEIVSHGMNRGILVLRHRKGSKNLLVACDNGGKYIYHSYSSGYNYGLDPYSTNPHNDASSGYRYDGYNSSIFFMELPREQVTTTDGVLSFGGIPYGSQGFTAPASGWIHWCKIWYEDLGSNNVRELAEWPHETFRMHYCGKGLHNKDDGTGLLDSATFIANAQLSQFCKFYPGSQETTDGSWKESELRTFLNTRVLKALPYAWQSLIKPVRIVTNGGSANPVLEYTTDKIYTPACADLTATTNNQLSAEGTRISWFVDNTSRIKFMGLIRPEDSQVIVTPNDPTLYTETYTVKEGDIWINRDRTGDCYMYVSAQTLASHGQLSGRYTADTQNNALAQGPQGGMWVRSNGYWTRSPSPDSGSSYIHYLVWAYGYVTTSSLYYSNDNNRAAVIMFSL